MAVHCIVFDCDGVLLDSVPVKTRAFRRLAEPFGPEIRDRFVLFHEMHGGVSRYAKFAWLFNEALGRAITPDESEEMGRRFAEYALDEVRRCPLIPGAAEVLDTWGRTLPLYVCSGAPQEEVRMVLRERGLDGYFQAIHGSPPGKTALLSSIVAALPVPASEVLMVGDAFTDRDAAREVGTLFYGVGELLRGGDDPWGPDLTSFTAWLTAYGAAF